MDALSPEELAEMLYRALLDAEEATMRALAWNSAMPVLEAGIEEALTHLHDDKGNLAVKEWTEDVVNGTKVYWKYGKIDDYSYFYVTNFNSSSTTPVIF